MSSHGSRLSCTTKEGFEIRYELIRLGTPSVSATARIVNKSKEQISSYDISEDIKRRQFGEARPFRSTENLFDIFVGNYSRNPSRRNWAGSDLSGGMQIHPGGIGNVLVPATDPLDAIFKKHDIEFWLSANFESHTEVEVKTDKGVELFKVQGRNVINRKAVFEYLKALLRSSRS
jgi:hypothetical protein